MKKIIGIAIAVCGFLLLGNVQASGADTKAFTIQTPAGVKLSNAYYPTDIVITNYSSRYIDIQVPVLGFSTRLYPHYSQHIIAYDPDPKRVILYDYNAYVFMDELLSNHQVLDVYDNHGKNTVKFN